MSDERRILHREDNSKAVLLREIHHRVKNNIQVILSLLNLQSSRIKNPSTRLLFQESQSRIRAMALVHERLYGSSDLERVEFSEYLRTLTVNLVQVYEVDQRHVTLEVEADHVFLSFDAALPCGLIVNELVSNALKHAFPNGRQGVIRVTMSRGAGDDEAEVSKEAEYVLVINDTGVGMPKGFDMEETQTLGLQLVSTLVDQLAGRLTLDRSGGTTATIRFQDHVPS